MTIWQIPRNDLKAAKAFYKANGDRLSQDEWGVIWNSQDDPKELEELAKDWRVDRDPTPNVMDLLG